MHLENGIEPVLTTDEVSRILRVPRSTVTYRARNGALPVAAKLPGKQGAYLFSKKKIETLARKES
ncbi:helix-turn-helix domain-containing protein [Corynebacterium diphtheriae]|uniref:helix-turn-helix domain-containing protein n=1 Tax=Corynebacterium diphtheriae TaxID=1717 RepID=UPI004042B234